jgi:hypothetical protein
MKRDIDFPAVKGVTVAIARKEVPGAEPEWTVYLINKNDYPLSNVLVASKGYGSDPGPGGEKQRTSILRHLIEFVDAGGSAIIERIDKQVFHLVNEYWVSYYVGENGRDIYDKKFLFMP